VSTGKEKETKHTNKIQKQGHLCNNNNNNNNNNNWVSSLNV
jgi:hypothetical protein